MHRYKIAVEYDGTPFHGWQRQKGLDTIQQRLEEAIIPLAKEVVVFHGAGRTDAGVHALRQVAHFDVSRELDSFRLQEYLNAQLKTSAISVLSVEKVSENFDARFSAVERFYEYKILNRRARSGLHANRAWHVIPQIDEEKMWSVAKSLVGKHDFSSFRAAGCQSSSPIKTLNSIEIERHGDFVVICVSARSFLYHQVRNMVGSLALVGCGKWSEQRLIDAFNERNRRKAGPTAPPCGLYFIGARY
ncbi:MAG: tRNA pseudouridine(38-40) synthase TruA [Holosporaceae bacterium]|jgi:tRNA pseudouridine38-40 synthase|nr:tRNA pseudouridine(38-40) synthase TruA [Holosporaceae bacterium]